jgi:hypothetical protein
MKYTIFIEVWNQLRFPSPGEIFQYGVEHPKESTDIAGNQTEYENNVE